MKILLHKIDISLARFENVLIVVTLSLMVILSFLQVLLRNFFNTGILWGDIFLRHLVLWVGFVGASLATREKRHIHIDILSRFVPKKWMTLIQTLIDVVSILICIVLAKASYVFLSFEIEANTILFENIPAWYFQIILPIGFALIAFRFLLKILERLVGYNVAGKVAGN
jgi:C4-dicarboxylate transporter DctQ subunit